MELLLPAERLLQAIDGLTGGLQDALSVPDPDLPGSGLKTDGTDGKQLTITSPRHPRPAVIPGCSWLHLLWVRVYIIQINFQQFLIHFCLFLKIHFCSWTLTCFFLCAACFPSEPWNWVSFFPQPTVMNFPAKHIISSRLKVVYKHHHSSILMIFLHSMNHLVPLCRSIWSHRTFTKVVLVDSDFSDRLKVFGHHDDCFLTCEHRLLVIHSFVTLLNV